MTLISQRCVSHTNWNRCTATAKPYCHNRPYADFDAVRKRSFCHPTYTASHPSFSVLYLLYAAFHLARLSPCLTKFVSTDIRIVKHILAIRVKGRAGCTGNFKCDCCGMDETQTVVLFPLPVQWWRIIRRRLALSSDWSAPSVQTAICPSVRIYAAEKRRRRDMGRGEIFVRSVTLTWFSIPFTDQVSQP
jgi:hypothetical protein